jgi:hypothetical protein
MKRREERKKENEKYKRKKSKKENEKDKRKKKCLS